MNAPTKPTPSISPSASAPVTTLKPPPFKMGQTSGVSKYAKILVYSAPGKGKTELMGSAVDVPEMCDVIYIDAEFGDATISDNPRIKNWESLINNRIQCRTFPEISKVHDWLVGHVKFRDLMLAKGADASAAEKILKEQEARLREISPTEIDRPQLFMTVILDSATEADQLSNYELLGVDEAKVLAGKSDDIDVATWDEFRKNKQRIEMLCRAFRNLPLHFLSCAHEQWRQDESKKFFYSPKLTGQLSRGIQGFFDVVGYLDVRQQGDQVQRRLFIQPTGPFDAKNRKSGYKEAFFADKDINMPTIMQKLGYIK